MTDFIQRARDLRKNTTEAEKLLWSKLRNNQFFDIKFRRQHPYPPYTLDFFCEEYKIAIELDGGQHNDPEQTEHDKNRTAFLEKGDVRVIRFWNNDVLNNTEGVLEEIKKLLPSHRLSPSPLPSPEGREGQKRIQIGEIATAHGIKGYVKVRSFVDDEKLLETPHLFTDEEKDTTITLKLKNALKGDWVAQVIGVDDRNDAEKLRGTKLFINRDALPAIDDGEFYIEDLKGMTVIDGNGQHLGIVMSVENFGGGDLLDIKPILGASFYAPFNDTTIQDIDKEKNTIIIELPEVM